MAKEYRLEQAKAGDVVRLAGDDKIDDRKTDVIVVLLVNATRARVQRVVMVGEKPEPFRAVDISPACPAIKLGTVADERYAPLIELVDPIDGRPKKESQMPIGKQKEGAAAAAVKAAPVKEKAGKAAAAPSNGAGRSSFTGKEKIKLLVKENPRREGTRAHKVYGLYKSGMTVAEFIAAGGGYGDIRWDVAKKNIELR